MSKVDNDTLPTTVFHGAESVEGDDIENDMETIGYSIE